MLVGQMDVGCRCLFDRVFPVLRMLWVLSLSSTRASLSYGRSEQ